MAHKESLSKTEGWRNPFSSFLDTYMETRHDRGFALVTAVRLQNVQILFAVVLGDMAMSLRRSFPRRSFGVNWRL
jgi:hypothetical protein